MLDTPAQPLVLKSDLCPCWGPGLIFALGVQGRSASKENGWPILPEPGSLGSSPREGWSVPPSRGLWFLLSLQMKPKADIMLISSSASHYFPRSCNRNNHFESNVSRKGNTFLNFQPIWKAASVLLCGWKWLF